ncbi:MAG: hypothetical protein ACLRWA_06075 [Lachnospira sp.]
MRITNQMMINSSMANIQVNKKQVNTLDTQLSTQKKINKPSEDPIIAIRALRLRASLNEVTQYLKKNIPDAQQWLSTTQGALTQGESVINKLYEYCNQGSADSYASEQRNTIAESLKALKKTFYDEGNVDYAGRYVFTGYKTDTTLTYQSDALAAEADYTITQKFGRDDISSKTVYTNAYSNADILNLNVSYDADGNAVMPNVESVYRLRLGYSDVKNTGYSLSYNNTDISFAADGTATVTTYQLDANGNKQLDADGNPITTTTTVNPDANGQYSITDSTGTALTFTNTTDKNYIPGDNEIAFNATTGEVLLGENVYKQVYTSDSFSFTYQKNNFVKDDLNPTMYYDCVDNKTGIVYDKVREDVEYNINYAQKIKINTEANEAFDINLGRDIDDLVTSVQNVLDLESQISQVEGMLKESQYSDEDSQKKLNSMLNGLNKQKTLAEDEMTKAFESGISQMQGYKQTISLANADVGNRLTRLELTQGRLTEQFTNVTESKSANEDIDLEDVVVSYTSAQLVYNASLQAASKVVQQTLLDFLG